MRFTPDWVSMIVGSKSTFFALFYFVFESNFPSTSPRGAYIWRGDLTEGFLRYRFGGLIFGGANTWRSLFSEFYGIIWKLRQANKRTPISVSGSFFRCISASIESFRF